jgi:putative membrane protein
MMGGYEHGFWGMGWFGGLFMILIWALIIIGIVVVVRKMMSGGMKNASPEHKAPDPLDILRERYARGEISTEEFEERKKYLRGAE